MFTNAEETGESRTAVARPQTGWRVAFDSLGSRDYRWFWFSLVMSFTGMQMQVFARGWLVFSMTNSPLDLGWVSFAFGLPLVLFSPLCGVVVDRMEKRTLIITSQIVAALVNLGIAVLISVGAIAVWHLVVASVITGIAYAFNLPARQAAIPKLVEPHRLMNAIALNSSGQTLSAIGAPPLAGILIAVIGIDWVYYVSVVFFALAAFLMFLIPPIGVASDTGSSAGGAVAGGFSYVRSKPILVTLLVFAFALTILGIPYQALMPVFSVDVLNVGSSGMGVLMAASGIGALIGSLAVASMGNSKHKGMMLLVSATLFGLLLIFFASSSYYYLSIGLLVVVGIANTIYAATNNTLLQIHVDDHMRGRVMGIYMASYGLIPIGVLAIGAVAEFTGVQMAVGAGGAILALCAIALAFLRPAISKL